MQEAIAVLRNAKRALRRASGQRKARLHQAINHLNTIMGRTERVVAQTRSRLAGVMPEPASRLVSLHDVDARPIRKGRLGKPVEFGYKAQVVDNADGVILDHNIEIGNPPDGPQLTPAIERITRRTGRTPRTVTADRGYGDASVERELHELGVASVAIPRRSKPSAARREFEHRRAFRDKVKWRTGSEGQDQPPQTKLRLEPHRTHRHRWSPNLVRTRRIRPQPRQDRRPGSDENHTRPSPTPGRPAPLTAVTPTKSFSGRSS